jgi:hypothetical protein
LPPSRPCLAGKHLVTLDRWVADAASLANGNAASARPGSFEDQTREAVGIFSWGVA